MCQKLIQDLLVFGKDINDHDVDSCLECKIMRDHLLQKIKERNEQKQKED